MDANAAYRLPKRVCTYVKLNDDGTHVYCDACNIPMILDPNSTNWSDMIVDIGTQINLGSVHKLCVTYWDKMNRTYEEIDFYWHVLGDKKALITSVYYEKG
jgi:hypothetical protein